ncbi:MAG: chaperonin GroEL [Dehalococcoidia bacterium]|nr:chaperonin GroEL [Dehalococcoidia bacterium]
MPKQILYGEEAREKLRIGLDALVNTVRTTLGPRGRNVALDRKSGPPKVMSDGITIAKEIELEDTFEDMGARLIRDAAKKTNDTAGDGTTTSLVLAQALVHGGFKNIAAGADPMVLKRGIERGAAAVYEQIKHVAKPVSGKADIAKIASLSAHESELGERIAEAMEKLGKECVIDVEEGKGLGLEVDYAEGLQYDRGYVSPYFVTDTERGRAEVNDPYILITDLKLKATSDILPVLEKIMPVTKNLVIIADEVEGEALAMLVVNKLRGTLNCLAVKAPGFGDRRKATLEDLAIMTGGTVISEQEGRKLAELTVQDLGRARKVTAEKENTTIIEGMGAPKAIKARMDQLRMQAEKTTSEWDKEKFLERLAKMGGGVAIFKVGGPTEVEMKERKARAEDALAATRAAVAEGIIPGGGVVLVRAQGRLDKLASELTGDERTGVLILKTALEAPIRTIAENAGQSGNVVLAEIHKHTGDYAFNAETMQFGHMLEQGIIDPAKVTRTALENAVSVAGMVLTAEALVADAPISDAELLSALAYAQKAQERFQHEHPRTPHSHAPA